MGPFDYLLTGLAAVQGSLANRGEKQSSSGTSSQVLDPSVVPLRDSIISKTQGMLNDDPNLVGYEAGQAENINRSSEIEKQKIRENLVLHGIDPDSPAGVNAINAAESRRFGAGINLHQQIPLLANNIRQQNIQTANSVLNSQPRTTTTSSVGSTGGNKLGGFVSGITQALATLHGLGAFGKPKDPKTTGTVLNTPGSPQIWP